MGRFIDWYAILNVPTDASAETIRAAYEARLAEPAVSGESPEEVAVRRGLLDRAFAVLGDEQRRMAYDMTGEGGYEEGEGREEAAAAPVGTAAEENPYAVLGLERNASVEEIQSAYAASLMALGKIGAAEVGASEMKERTERLSRAFHALMERKQEAVRPVSRGRTALGVGVAFATIAATIWNYLVLSNPGNVPANLVAAPNEASAVAFWAASWFGCFAVWLLMLFIGFAVGKIDADAAASGLRSAGHLLSLLDPRTAISLICGPMVFWVMATGDYSIIIWLAVLFIVVLVKERNATRAMLLQVAIVCGHMLFVNYTAYFWAGNTVFKAYVVNGLSSVGFLSWWIVAYGCYWVYERSVRPG